MLPSPNTRYTTSPIPHTALMTDERTNRTRSQIAGVFVAAAAFGKKKTMQGCRKKSLKCSSSYKNVDG